MDQFSALGSVAYQLHMELRNLYFLLLPIFFLLSVTGVWFKNPTGGPEFLEAIKRAIIATLLLVGFAEITDAILFITTGVADKIDNMSGLDSVIQMASEKAHSYTVSPMTPILAFDDLMVAALSYGSYAILYVARFVMVAIYHFAWVFLTIISPMLLLFHLFTSQITVNLFRSLTEVACWRIVWSVLSVMLKSLPFGTWYAMQGNYLTIAVLNFVIAICMIGTPFVVHSLVGSGLTSMTGGLSGAVTAVMMATPARTITATNAGRSVLTDFSGFGKGFMGKFAGSGHQFHPGERPVGPPPPTMTAAQSLPPQQKVMLLPPPPPGFMPPPPTCKT